MAFKNIQGNVRNNLFDYPISGKAVQYHSQQFGYARIPLTITYSTTGTFDAPAANMFDQDTATFATCAYQQSCAAIFSIPFTSSLKCYITTNGSMDRNGGTVFRFTGGTTNASPPFNVTFTGWYDFTSIGSPFTQIDWTRTTGSFGAFGVSAIEADGLLVLAA